MSETMTLNIRVGGRYRTRGGEDAEVTRRPFASGDWPFRGHIGGTPCAWREDGRFWDETRDDPRDLVSEITEPTAPTAVHPDPVLAERIRSGCPDTVGDEAFAMTVEWPGCLMGKTFRIEHDGFEGEVIGSYYTKEGKRGVVLQQTGTRVVHVYGEKWLRPAEGDKEGEA